MFEEELKNELELKLKNLPNLQLMEWLPINSDDALLREVAWYNFSRNAAVPASKVSANGDIPTWLKSCMEKMNIQSECLLSLGSISQLLKINVKNDWLEELWHKEAEFIIFYKDKIFGFIEEEYFYEFHQSEIEAVNAKKSAYLMMRGENKKSLPY